MKVCAGTSFCTDENKHEFNNLYIGNGGGGSRRGGKNCIRLDAAFVPPGHFSLVWQAIPPDSLVWDMNGISIALATSQENNNSYLLSP